VRVPCYGFPVNLVDEFGQSKTALACRDARGGDEAGIRALVFGVLAEYGLVPDPAPGGTDADLIDVVASYAGRGGVFRVVTRGDEIVGCGGLFPLDGGEAEIRKMYLAPEVRGQGLGRKLLQELIDAARARGFQRIVLETATVLREAIALYQRFGFVPVTRAHLAGRCDKAMALSLL
jgi:GNAT superfamily N-acetyltransferase